MADRQNQNDVKDQDDTTARDDTTEAMTEKYLCDRRIPTLGIAGFSDSGKTTLICGLIKVLKEKGIRTAVIKHDVHGISEDDGNKDTGRFRQAGACGVILCHGRGGTDDEKKMLAEAVAWLSRAGTHDVPCRSDAPCRSYAPCRSSAPFRSDAPCKGDAPCGSAAPYKSDAPCRSAAQYKSDDPCRSAVISINACKDLSAGMHTDENSDLTINTGKDTSTRTVADEPTFTNKNKLRDRGPKADLILIEGFKRLTFPKIGIARLATGKGFCSEETAFIACVSDILKPDKELCRFTLDDYEGISSFIIENMDRLI
jgi:molybdopterin-guanine dinucleotide biosynthesis protein